MAMEPEEASGDESLLRDSRQLADELAQCKADKDFVWSLWKQLQKDSPDKTALVNMIITREKLRSERRCQELGASLAARESQLAHYSAVLASTEDELSNANMRARQAASEVALLESRLEGQHMEAEKQAHHMQQLVMECERLKERCSGAEGTNKDLEESRESLVQEISGLREMVGEGERQQAEQTSCHQALEQQLIECRARASELASACSVGAEQVKSAKQELVVRTRQLCQSREACAAARSELALVREQLGEVGSARDTWANHASLQAATIRRLQQESDALRSELAASDRELSSLAKTVQELSSQLDQLSMKKEHAEKEEKGKGEAVAMEKEAKEEAEEGEMGEMLSHPACPAPSADGSGRGTTPCVATLSCGEATELLMLLEATEVDLFEARAQLQAKAREAECLRAAHNRRLKRIRALQANHKLLEEQLLTFEAKESQHHPRQKVPTKALRHENSEAVWNELSHYKHKCLELETKLVEVEEERDTLEVADTHHQAAIAQLRKCLQIEKDDLEQKISAIAECEAQASVTSLEHSQKVADLEKRVSQLLSERKRLQAKQRKSEETCYSLREDATRMQSSLVQLEHEREQKKLLALGKAAMTQTESQTESQTEPQTERAGEAASLSTADSATQVDLITPPEVRSAPEMQDAQVSPIHPLSLHHSTATQPLLSTAIHSSSSASSVDRCRHCCCCHRLCPSHHTQRRRHRACSEGDVLVLKSRAREARDRVRSLSDSLGLELPGTLTGGLPCNTSVLSLDQLSPEEGSSTLLSAEVDRELQKKSDFPPAKQSGFPCVTPKVKVHDCARVVRLPGGGGKMLSRRENKSASVAVTGAHRCVWQQRATSLQQRLLNSIKQVKLLSDSKQSVSLALEKEAVVCSRAKTEAKDMGQRMVLQKAALQAAQDEVCRTREDSRELERRCASLEQQRQKGRTEAEWRRLEAERKAAHEKCSSLNHTLKTLKAQLEEQTDELSSTRERCSRMERDARQRRSLVDEQRRKLKLAQEEAATESKKAQRLAAEAISLSELVGQHRRQVELLRAQLTRHSEDRAQLVELLDQCQGELALTLEQLTACEGRAKRSDAMVARATETLQTKVEEVQRECEGQVRQVEAQLRAHKEQVKELQVFAETLASSVNEQFLSVKKQKKRRKCDAAKGREVCLMSRAREIARSALQLSDDEVDEFFSDDIPSGSKKNEHSLSQADNSFTYSVAGLITSKPPFAAELTRLFVEFLAQITCFYRNA